MGLLKLAGGTVHDPANDDRRRGPRHLDPTAARSSLRPPIRPAFAYRTYDL
jgi:hypothetical protein